MSDFESKTVITHENFVYSANRLLDEAQETQTTLEQATRNAQNVVEQLGRVASGETEVQPPLEESEVQSFSEKASLILSISNKATTAVEETRSRRGFLKKKSDKQAASFTGVGSAAKG